MHSMGNGKKDKRESYDLFNYIIENPETINVMMKTWKKCYG